MDTSQIIHGGLFLAILIGVIFIFKSAFELVISIRIGGPDCLRRPFSHPETRRLLFWVFVTAVFVFLVFFAVANSCD